MREGREKRSGPHRRASPFRAVYGISFAMEKPQIRFIEAIPLRKGREAVSILRDSEGISREALAVSRARCLHGLAHGRHEYPAGTSRLASCVLRERWSTWSRSKILLRCWTRTCSFTMTGTWPMSKALYDDYDRLPVRPAYLRRQKLCRKQDGPPVISQRDV